MCAFEHYRSIQVPDPQILRKVDACVSVSKDLIRLLNDIISGVEDTCSINPLSRKHNAFAGSVFSDWSLNTGDSDSVKTKLSNKLIDAAADLATRKVELESIRIEQEHEAKFEALQLEHQKLMEERSRERKLIEAEKSLALAEVKVNTYSKFMQSEFDTVKPHSNSYSPILFKGVSVCAPSYPTPVVSQPSYPDSVPMSITLNSNAPAFQPRYTLSSNNVNFPPNQQTTRVQQQSATAYAPRQPSHIPYVYQQPTNLSYTEQPTVTTNAPETNATVSNDSVMNSLAKVFADSVNLNRLPVPEPSVFTGDPLRFVEWKTAFYALIERKGIPEEERLFYLKKYVAGEALQVIDGYFYIGSSSAYDSARKVLEDRYGHPFVVQKAFRKKLENWPKIGDKDSRALRNYGDFLKACLDATPQIPSLQILDDCTENQKLMSKLPSWAALRWNRQVQETIDSIGNYPKFSAFVGFVIKETRIACNPVSSLHALHESDNKVIKDSKCTNRKASVLTTALHDQGKDATADRRVCEYCGRDGHWIFKCENFLSLSIDIKRAFIRKKNFCFGCLRKGHRNKDCKRKHVCDICKGKHPACLHEREPPLKKQTSQDDTVVNQATSLHVNRGNRKSNGTSMIVPVWVSTVDNPTHEVLTYALLDAQSDTTFILQETLTSLHAPSKLVRLSLSTMTSQNSVIDSCRASDLQVRGFNSSSHIKINNLYTRDFIPADRSHIPVRDTIKDLPHLQEIANELPPLQSCEIGLLIGYNCPQALAPVKLLRGRDNEPYAVKTSLGWSVVGYSTEATDNGLHIGYSHRTSVKEIHICSPKDVIKVLESDFAHDKREDAKFSQEDIQFLNFMENAIKEREDTHLEMPLPFKKRPTLPNNKVLALLRLKHLKRCLSNDSKYYEHYKKFMNDVIDREDAELVTLNETTNVWYIPHHGV